MENVGYRAVLPPTLAHLSCRQGRCVTLDPAMENIADDEEAVKLARPVYREP